MNNGLAQPGTAGPGLPHADRDQPRAMRGKFSQYSALAFTVIAERCTSVSEPANSGELPVWAIFDAVTALRLRRS